MLEALSLASALKFFVKNWKVIAIICATAGLIGYVAFIRYQRDSARHDAEMYEGRAFAMQGIAEANAKEAQRIADQAAEDLKAVGAQVKRKQKLADQLAKIIEREGLNNVKPEDDGPAAPVLERVIDGVPHFPASGADPEGLPAAPSSVDGLQ